MNENYYVYYIIPDSNFVSEKETGNNSENLSEQVAGIIKTYFPLILLILLIIFVYKQLK